MALRDTWHRALVYFGLAEDPTTLEHDLYEPETGRARRGLRGGSRTAVGDRQPDLASAAARATRSTTSSPTTSRRAAGRVLRPGRRQRRRRRAGAPRHARTASTTPRRSPTVQARGPGDPQPADDRGRARQAPDRLRLGPHLRARRRHAEDRREDLPAHARATSRSRPRRRPASSRRASSTRAERRAVARVPRGAARIVLRRMRVGFAGAGNMARRWRAAGPAPSGGPEAMLFCDSRRAGGARSPSEVGGEAVDALAELAAASDVVVLAVKPAALDDVAARAGRRGAASSRSSPRRPGRALAEAFPGTPVVRVMPNHAGRGPARRALPRAARAACRTATAGALLEPARDARRAGRARRRS